MSFTYVSLSMKSECSNVMILTLYICLVMLPFRLCLAFNFYHFRATYDPVPSRP